MGSFAGAEQVLIDAWVQARLASFAIELDEEDAGLSTRVYPDFALPGAQYPFIIFQCQSPPRDVRGVGVTRVMVDTLYVVKAVAQVDSYAPLQGIAHIIDKALTSPEGSVVDDGLVFTSVREEGFNLVEVEQGTQFRHLGGQFKIQAQG